MNELFNTKFETGLRLLLALYTISPRAVSIDRLTTYDFIALYGKDFDISENNLNGINGFNFSELPARRKVCSDGLREFALDGLISLQKSKTGFKYKISKAGKSYVESLDSDYAKQYMAAITAVHQVYGNKADTTLVREINVRAVQSLRR